MQVGLVSDIHGNRVALEAVLADMPPVDALVCAGDVVGYNPWHGDCVDAMRERGVPTVLGNHDRAVAHDGGFAFSSAAGAGVRHARETLTDDQLAWLADLPPERTAVDGRVRLVHGHPEDPDRYTFPEQFGPHLLGEEEEVLVLGHTHIQHHERYEEGVVVNPGSVGQPRDGDPRAAYALLDLAELTVEQRRVEYDIEAVVAAIDAAGLPASLGERLREGR
jgi:putative phosphoesterase